MRPDQLLKLGLCALFIGLSSCKNAEKETETHKQEIVNESNKLPRGLALYTLREAMAADPEGTLKRVADIGYDAIEAAGYQDGRFYGMKPAEFKSYLDSLGIDPLSTHMGGISLENADTQIADAKAAGFRYLVIPVPPMGHFTHSEEEGMGMSPEVEEVASIMEQIGKRAQKAGLQVLYHNHDFEFRPNAEGIVPMDYFIEHIDPQAVKFQLDLYWIIKAGKEPSEYFAKAPGRFVAWHLKDMDSLGRFAPVGTGSIDFETIVGQKESSGMQFYFVEQDATFGQDPFEAIALSYANLEDLGL